jgi:hypothetical protein
MSDTPNHSYNTPEKGTENWHGPLNENFENLEVDVELRDEGPPGSNNYEPADGAKYLDTATGLVYLADGNTWTQVFDLTGGGGGGTSLSGGDGIDPSGISDGDTISVVWNDATSLDANGAINNFSLAADLDVDGRVDQLSGSVAGGQTLTDIAGTNLNIDSSGTLNASGGSGGGIQGLSGGDGINPDTIGDGDTLTAAWGDAASLDSSGDIDNFGSAASLDAAGLINDFSSAASLDLNGNVDAGRYLTTSSGGQVDFAGPAEWSNSGATGTNTVSGGAATVAGGESNEASNLHATVAGGRNNTASGVNSTVGGGEDNEATNGDGTIGGGVSNVTSAGNTVVSGGTNNKARTNGSTVGGGATNIAEGNYATVAGGNNNLVTGDYGTIAGGAPQNPPEDSTQNAVYDAYGTVGGGSNNQAGSDDGTANAEYATVPGGRNNTASGAYSTAIGRNATASEDGSFVVGDSTSTEVTPSSSDEAVFQMPVNTSATFSFTEESIFLSAFENGDGNDVFTVSVPGQYFPFDMLRVVENGNVTVAGNLAFSEGLQSDTGTNVVINSDNELAADSSSARHKTDIQPHSTSDGVLDLELRSFQYEETGSEDVGFIAEEVEEHVPEIVTYDDEDRPFGVKYDRVGAHLVPEVRDNRDRLADVESEHDAVDDRVADLKAELDAKDARIDDQQDRIEKLEAENERLTAENDALRERIAAIEDTLGIGADQQAVADD